MKLDKKNPFQDYKAHKISGGNFLDEKPLFCKKGKQVVIFNQSTVSIYQSATGEHLGELFTCPNKIICLQTDPRDDDFLIALTVNGQIFRSDLTIDSEATQLCQLSLNADILNEQKVRKLLIKKKERTTCTDWTNNLDDVRYHHVVFKPDAIWASWSTKDDKAAHLSIFDKKTGEQINKHAFPAAVLQKVPENFVVGHDFVACLSGTSIHVMKISTEAKVTHFVRAAGIEFTKLATYPSEEIFATGDTLGKIVVWRNIHESEPLRDVYHWHTLPVRALVFTECGTHIFSGGEENVLVKWSLASGLKTFLPRLSSNIFQLSIAEGSSLLSVSTTDAKILIVNISLACLSTIQHFSRWSTISVAGESGKILTQDPRTDALVLSGKTGHLQYLSTTNLGRFLCTLDVTQRNYMTRERDIQPVNVEVIFAKFTRCGKWLVTAEVGSEEARLKFWLFDTEKQEFSLNSDVDAPHGSEGIDSLEVSSNELAVTTGPDLMFRLWGVVETIQFQKLKVYWMQIGCSGYRQMPGRCADFARDGSLLAVGFGPSLTLWDTKNYALKCSLTPPLQRSHVKSVKFGNHNLSHLVITGTDNALSCWNIVTLCRQWEVPVNLCLLVSDPNSRYMCAFTKSRNLFIFDPSSPQPALRLDRVSDTPVRAAHFVAKTDAPYLYFLTERQNLYYLGRDEKASAASNAIEKITPFSAQLAKNIRKDVIGSQGLTRVNNVKKFSPSILDSPAHILPHISLLCEDVLNSMLLSVHVSENQTGSVHTLDENIESFNALKLPEKLSEPELDVEVDHLFIK